MDATTPVVDHYFQILKHLPAAVRAELISRLVKSLVVRTEPLSHVEALAAGEAGRGGWADLPDDFAEELRNARTSNSRPDPEW